MKKNIVENLIEKMRTEVEPMENKEIESYIKSTKESYAGMELCDNLIKEMDTLVRETFELKELDEKKVWEEFKKIEEPYLNQESYERDSYVYCENIIDEFANTFERVFEIIKNENKKSKKKTKNTEFKI